MSEEKIKDSLQVRVEGGSPDTVIKLIGKLASSLPAEVREQVLSLIRPRCRLILDLSGVTYVSGVGYADAADVLADGPSG